jgi:hypothetical protein
MNKSNTKDFDVTNYTWKFAYDAIGESVYNSVVSSLKIIDRSVWDFGWDCIEEDVETSLRHDVWGSARDYFEQNSLTTQDLELL